MGGLFGLLYTTFVAGAKGIKQAKNTIENEENKKQAILKGHTTYLDADLCMRDVATNKKIMNYSIPNQYGGRDDVLKVVGSDEILLNKTDIARKEEEKKWRDFAFMVGGSTYKIGGVYDFNCKAGGRYRDIKTGSIYTIVDIKHRTDYYNFYMDMESMKLVRPTDEWVLHTMVRAKEMEEEGNHRRLVHPDVIMDEWNKKDVLDRKLYIQKNSIEYCQDSILKKLNVLNRKKIYNENENYENIKHIFYWDDIIKEEDRKREEQQQKKIAELKSKKYIIVNVTKYAIVAKLPGGKLEYF